MRLPWFICWAGLTAASSFVSAAASPQEKPAPSCIPVVQGMQFDIVHKDMPFTGTLVATCEVPQPDGSVAKGKTVIYLWRDSEGRTRRQDGTPMFPGSKVFGVSVTDPVHHLDWHWTLGGGDKTAIVSKYDALRESKLWPDSYPQNPDGSRNYDIFAHAPPAPGFKDESLPPQYINGVYAEGDRITEVVAPGMMNNHTDHSQIVVTEDWASPDLAENVRWIERDPSTGTDDNELIVSDRSDPDPRLFEPPPDFQVIISMPQNQQAPPPDRLKVIPVPAPSVQNPK